MRITLRTLYRKPARQAIAADEALLDQAGTPFRTRFWLADGPAVVVGLGLHHRLASVVDLERTAACGVDVVARRAGGGALLLDPERVLCGAIAVPTAHVARDVTESYRWLGEALVVALARLGVGARRVEVAEARADIAALRASSEPVARLLLSACYGALSPHEVVVETPSWPAKLVGLAQVRRRETTLFQFGVLLRDQSPLADFLRIHAERQVEDRPAEANAGTSDWTVNAAAEAERAKGAAAAPRCRAAPEPAADDAGAGHRAELGPAEANRAETDRDEDDAATAIRAKRERARGEAVVGPGAAQDSRAEGERAALRVALQRRTIGLEALTSRSASEVAEAIADAMPSAP